MPLFREDNFLIVHAGSQHTLLLFGLLDLLTPPQFKVPTVVYLDKTANEYHAANTTGEYTEVWPIRAGRVVDVPAFEAFLKFVLQTIIHRHPIITINQIPLLLVAPLLSYSRSAIERVTKFVFETLEFTAFNVLDLSVATTYGLGATSSCLVVNVGHESSQIVPVVGGTAIKYAGKRLAVGGATIDEELRKLLPNLTSEQLFALKSSPIYEVLNDHQDSFYSMADLSELKNASDDEFDVAKIVTEENGEKKLDKTDEDEQKPNSELQNNFFLDPQTNTKVYVGKERFQGTARLVAALAEGIWESLQLVPQLDKRQECFDNIVFVGSTSNITGLKQAVVIKLCEDYLTKPQATKKKGKNDLNGVNSTLAAFQLTDDAVETTGELAGTMQVPYSIKLVKHPDYFPEWKKPKERGGAWSEAFVLGAEIYAKQIFGANSNHGGDSFIDTDIYEERGPQAIWDVCL